MNDVSRRTASFSLHWRRPISSESLLHWANICHLFSLLTRSLSYSLKKHGTHQHSYIFSAKNLLTQLSSRPPASRRTSSDSKGEKFAGCSWSVVERWAAAEKGKIERQVASVAFFLSRRWGSLAALSLVEKETRKGNKTVRVEKRKQNDGIVSRAWLSTGKLSRSASHSFSLRQVA